MKIDTFGGHGQCHDTHSLAIGGALYCSAAFVSFVVLCVHRYVIYGRGGRYGTAVTVVVGLAQRKL